MIGWLKRCVFKHGFDIPVFFPANCNQPPLIPRATVDTSTGTLEGDIAVYTCGINTVQEGFGETVCQKNGMWSEVDMYCRRKYSIFTLLFSSDQVLLMISGIKIILILKTLCI